MAMPRSASAGASSRSATSLSAPSASPPAKARAAAAMIESMPLGYHACALASGVPEWPTLPPSLVRWPLGYRNEVSSS